MVGREGLRAVRQDEYLVAPGVFQQMGHCHLVVLPMEVCPGVEELGVLELVREQVVCYDVQKLLRGSHCC